MRLLLMRHGIAAPIGGKIRTDAERPLTEEGQEKTEQVAQGLVAMGEKFDLIATSPLLRALETAEIVQKVYAASGAKPRFETWSELEHSHLTELQTRLSDVENLNTFLLVGHEPGFSRLTAQLLTGSPTGLMMDFKKAGVCALEIAPFSASDAPRATLLWYAISKQLRLMKG